MSTRTILERPKGAARVFDPSAPCRCCKSIGWGSLLRHDWPKEKNGKGPQITVIFVSPTLTSFANGSIAQTIHKHRREQFFRLSINERQFSSQFHGLETVLKGKSLAHELKDATFHFLQSKTFRCVEVGNQPFAMIKHLLLTFNDVDELKIGHHAPSITTVARVHKKLRRLDASMLRRLVVGKLAPMTLSNKQRQFIAQTVAAVKADEKFDVEDFAQRNGWDKAEAVAIAHTLQDQRLLLLTDHVGGPKLFCIPEGGAAPDIPKPKKADGSPYVYGYYRKAQHHQALAIAAEYNDQRKREADAAATARKRWIITLVVAIFASLISLVGALLKGCDYSPPSSSQ